MPTVLTPQGWVKVAPPKRNPQPVSNPANILRGPLAYLACQPQVPTLNPVAGNVKGKSPFPYDLSASPEKLKRQSQAIANRTVSAPVMHGALHHDDEGEDDHLSEPDMDMRRHRSRSKPKSKPSRHHHHHHDEDDDHSIASSNSSSSTSSGGGAHSRKSYPRHRPPVDARPREQSSHPAPRNDYYSGPRYDHYAAPPPVHMAMGMGMPMPAASGRSLSYSWYNATTPLDLR